jgi:hypothetical protein
MIGEGGPGPFLNYTLEFALQLSKSTGNLSQGSRVVGDCSLRRLGRLFTDSLGWHAEHPVHLGYPWVTSVSPWSAQVPSKLPN